MHGGDQDHRVPKLDLLHNYTLKKKVLVNIFFFCTATDLYNFARYFLLHFIMGARGSQILL